MAVILIYTIIGGVLGGWIGSPEYLWLGVGIGAGTGFVVGLILCIGAGETIDDVAGTLPDSDHDGIPDVFDD